MRPTVLCVDDDRNLCQIIAKALKGEGYQVRLAHDGEEALASIHLHSPDLVLLDVMLPKRDGFQVLEELRSSGGPLAETPTILFTGCTRTPVYVERAEALRAAALLTKPVPLDALLGMVAKQVAGGPPVQPHTQEVGRYQKEGSRPVSGQLQTLAFPALLHHLHGMRASGVLHLRSGRKHKRLELQDGRPVAVRSNLMNECLGNLLVRTGRITQAQLAESARRMRRGEGLQGQILVAMELLSEQELGQALRAQAEEKLFEIFEWRGGRFELARATRLERANTLSLDRSPADVILTGVRERFPLQRIDAFLAASANRCLVPGESPFYRFQEIALDPAAEALVHAEEEPLRVRELAERDEATRRAVYGLVVTGLLELREGPPEPARVESQPTRAAPSPDQNPARLGTSAASETRQAARSAAVPVAPVAEPQAEAVAGPASAEPAPPASVAEQTLRAELATLLERFRGASYFQILGLPETAGDEAVRRAYADLAMRTHPDRYGNASATVKALAEQAFAMVARAYEALADAKRRAEYQLDRRREEREAAELEEGHRALRAELEFQKGQTKLRARDYGAAVECFQWAVSLYPEEGEYHAHLGWALYLADKRSDDARREALKHVRKGAKLAPDREKTYLFLGRLLRAGGRIDLAQRALTRAIQLRPDCVEALRELRLLQMRRGKAKGLIGRLLRR